MELNTDNSIVKNKTYKYLAPSFRVFGDTFVAKFNSVHKLAIGIHDCILDGTEFEGQPLVYVLLDKWYRPPIFKDFINWIQYQDYFVHQYAYDDLLTGRRHMVVLRYPQKYEDIYYKFTQGKYSQMYSKQELRRIFEGHPAYDVLNRSPKARVEFTERLNTKYHTTILPSELIGEGLEYDFPLDKREEFFNYKGE